MVSAKDEISASRTSSRGRKPASAIPSGMRVGRSLAEWTAASISPASSAMSISLVNRPLPPASASGRSWIASPLVRMMRSSMVSSPQPCASASRRRVSLACASASGEPRVPRTRCGEAVMIHLRGSVSRLYSDNPRRCQTRERGSAASSRRVDRERGTAGRRPVRAPAPADPARRRPGRAPRPSGSTRDRR